MFNSNFYPTPPEVIAQMLHSFEEYELRNLFILEPSAGKGDILDYIKENHFYRSSDGEKLFCIEKEEELVHILQGKGFKVIANDFLTFNEKYHFDLIIMNPPFENCEDHFLQAWHILKKGKLRCLLPTEVFNNPYLQKRKLIKNIVGQNVEDLGQCFKQAERKTEVFVSLVSLEKNENESSLFDNESFESEKVEYSEENFINPLARKNLIETLVIQYECAKEALLKEHGQKEKYYFYVNNIMKVDKPNLNNDLEVLKHGFWIYLFAKSNLSKNMTSNFKTSFLEFIQRQKNIAFSEDNIYKVFDMFLQNSDQIIQNSIEKVFDTTTSYHKDNKIHVEGWSSNDAFHCTKKIVIPYSIDWRSRGCDILYFSDSN
jgi:hypothetical protein